MTATRFAATVSYDGSAFAGSQRQANGRTVQGELETAAAALFGAQTRVQMAGRTDAGVHAIGQVAAFTAETRLNAATVGRALNAHLPGDVAVRDVRVVPGDFDPRRWARKRLYRYTVWNAEARAPLRALVSDGGQPDVVRASAAVGLALCGLPGVEEPLEVAWRPTDDAGEVRVVLPRTEDPASDDWYHERIRALGYRHEKDETAIYRFQTAFGLDPTGTLDTTTRAKVREVVEADGSLGDALGKA